MSMLTRLLDRPLYTFVCAGLTFFTISVAQAQTTWTGAASSSYTLPANWSPQSVPTATDDVIIPQNGTTVPVVTAGGTTVVTVTRQPVLNALGRANNLTINANASLTVTAGSTLNLGATLAANGFFGGDGELATVGTTNQLLDGSNTATIALGNLTIGSAGATLARSMNLARRLLLSGNLTTNSNITLTLLSTVDATAFVVNSGGSVVGNATIQRYIDGSINPGLGYRHYSSPVVSTTVADLTAPGFTPEIGQATVYNNSLTPQTTRPFPTVYNYDQARVVNTAINYTVFERGYQVPLTLATPLEQGRGYAVNIGASSLVDFVGMPFSGDLTKGGLLRSVATTGTAAQIAAANAQSGWHLLGNPYPSPLDYSAVTSGDMTNLDGAIYVIQSTGQYTNVYRSFVNSLGQINPILPIAQGFFMRVSAPGLVGSITFRNSQRLTTSDGTTFQRTAAADTRPKLQLSLSGGGLPTSYNDASIIYFENGSTSGFDSKYDAVKLPNATGLNLSTLGTDGEALSIDGRLAPTSQITIPLQVFAPASGTYTLTADQLNNMAGYYAYLRDIQTGNLTTLAPQVNYTFSLNAFNTAPRFEVVISPQPLLATASAALTQQVSLYPSPTKDVAYLELPASLGNQALTANLVDAMGRSVRTAALPAQGTAAHKLGLTGLAAGVYALQLRTDAGIVVKRLVIE